MSTWLEVVQLPGFQGPWKHQVCRGASSHWHGRYGAFRVFLLASGSSALVRIECGGGETAWIVGILMAPSVQDTDCLICSSYGPIRVFIKSLAVGNQRASLAGPSLLLGPFTHLKGTFGCGNSLLLGTSGI